MTRNSSLILSLAVLPLLLAGSRPAGDDDMHKKVTETIAAFKKTDPGISKFFGGAVGYAVFPSVGKGGIGVGGARGSGELIVGGNPVGRCKLTQVTVGLQLGGQKYSEVIFFETQKTVDAFRKGDFEFAAQVSAVALKSGASADAAFKDGVAVFTQAKGGLMYEASVGGQKFDYENYGEKKKD
ncbi:MAG TPA: YSC84-related protein [Gemmatimonadales bacterium]|nr:YSC84-related protein [Gemmatimonadales bacterium]